MSEIRRENSAISRSVLASRRLAYDVSDGQVEWMGSVGEERYRG